MAAIDIPSLSQISQQQANLYETYFRQVNPSGTGTVGASEAAAFLKKSGLPEGILHTIWDLSDQGSKGYLDKKGFYIALKLISLAQNGHEVSLNSLSIPTSPPRMGESPRGFPPPKQISKTETTSWGIKAKEKLQYDAIFDGLKPVNGLLSGDKVKPVLLNSKLPVDVLGRIWDISDIDQDGSLDRDEFSVAMHLVYRAIDGEVVPVTLPLLLVPPSKRKIPISHISMPANQGSIRQPQQISLTGDKQWVQPSLTGEKEWVQPSLTGEKQWIQPSLTGDKQWIQPNLTGDNKWMIPPSEKAKYNQMFLQADSDKDGLVAGGEIKDVLLASALPQHTLAHIWNLCDKNNTGLLNADQFAFAMHLIAMVKAGKELPQNVSAEMIHPKTHSPVSHSPLQSRPSNDLSQISLESSSSDFSAIKELDQITTEIEALGREKASLQKEISETEEAIRNRKSEIEDLQNELQKGNKVIEHLNQQKAQSQSQLDSLDSEKNNFEEQFKEIQMKIQDEKQTLNQQRSQYKSQQESCKDQEIELQRARKELDEVRKEESELELQVENNKKEFESLKEKIARAKADISKSQTKIDKLSEENNSLKEEISQYTNSNNLRNGSSHLTELNDNFETRFKDMDQVSARATAGSSPVSSISGFSGSGGVGEDEENDDFKDTDPFKNKDDPFGGNENEPIDPFSSDDPFKTDPFKTVSFADDPFSVDPFQDNDPFKTDPFKEVPCSDMSSTKGDGIVSDPFSSLDPFGTGAFVATNSGNSAFSSSGKAKSIESNSSDPFSNDNLFSDPPRPSSPNDDASSQTDTNDPFATDPFASGDPFATPNTDDPFSSTSTTTNDPFVSTDDPFLSANPSSAIDPFATPGEDPFKSDPFASTLGSGDDPFLSSTVVTSDSNDPWFAFSDTAFNNDTKTKKKDNDNFSTQTFSSEENQLKWAKRESEREETERQKRLKELQDQEEMEMAIALKQSVESSSDA